LISAVLLIGGDTVLKNEINWMNFIIIVLTVLLIWLGVNLINERATETNLKNEINRINHTLEKKDIIINKLEDKILQTTGSGAIVAEKAIMTSAAKKSVKKIKKKKVSKTLVERRYTITFYKANTATTGSTMASGKKVYTGAIAMNRNEMRRLGIKFGQKVKIVSSRKEWNGIYTVEDTGCAISIIDIFVSKSTKIPSYGIIKNTKLYIIKTK
jgi:3D (Asp-Asp-Asp) domain-containing protein